MFTNEQVNEWRAQRTTDQLLDLLLDVVLGSQDEKAHDIGMPITVAVKGQMISGYAVPAKAWAESVGEEAGEAFGDAFERHLQMEIEVRELATAQAKENGMLSPDREYLHLKDVTIAGFNLIKWMRVRLDSVDAWTLAAPKV